ncbi:phage tail protein [Enterococcus faecalis]|uniref:major tail protein n=1 Tax=Enterococcus faecalis TaxID=1351 RepID=UPI0021C5D81C|nr:major tail protein [Enterococcus faecalis]MCU2257744.1 phage tail protein [Enterococcus faecalis]
MATVGFERAIVGVHEKNTDSEKVTQEFNIDSKQGGTIDAKISGLAAASNTTFASDGAFHVSAVGSGSPKCAFQVADLYPELYDAITGAEKTPQGYTALGKNTRPPYVSIIFISHDKDGNEIYIALLKGKFGAPDEELKTAEDKGSELQTDSIEGNFVNRGLDGYAYVKAKAEPNDNGQALKEFKAFVFNNAEGQTTP